MDVYIFGLYVGIVCTYVYLYQFIVLPCVCSVFPSSVSGIVMFLFCARTPNEFQFLTQLSSVQFSFTYTYMYIYSYISDIYI